MTIELRPLSIGEILDRTAQLYRSHFLLFVGIAVFPRALLLLWQLLQIGILRFLNAHNLSTTAFTIGGAVLGFLLYFLFVGLGVASTNRAVSALYLGQPTSIAHAYQQVRPHWFRYVGIMALSTLYAWGPTLLPYAAILAVVGLNGKKFLPGASPATGLAIVAIAAVFMLVTIPLGIWMTLRYAVAIPVAIFEDTGAIASLKRSVFLTRKGRARIFVMMLLVGIVFWTLLMAAEVPFMVQVFKAAKNHQQPPVLSLIYGEIISFVLYCVIGPVYGIAITLFYYDERIRKEGFDIEWMMQRANLTAEERPTEQTPAQAPDTALG